MSTSSSEAGRGRRSGGPPPAENLWAVWRRNAEDAPDREAIVHYVAGVAERRWTRRALIERAARAAGLLAQAGVRAGEVCALVLRHHAEFYPTYMGIVALGAIPSVLAYPNPRLHPDKFRHGLRGMSRVSGLDWLLTDRDLEPTVRPLISDAGSTIRDVLFPFDLLAGESGAADPALRAPDVSADAPCLLQHSSGTTGLQKGVLLSHRAVLEHVRRYGDAIALTDADRVVSWLPLYHDMGLIAAFHLPLAFGIPTVQLDPFEWVTAPALFLEACSSEAATLAWLPNFAYQIMSSRVNEDDLADLRLDSVRMLVNCSEPVRAEAHARFAAKFAPCGFRPSALGASYAMAETTFAVTQTPPGVAARELVVSRASMTRGLVVAPADAEPWRTCVSSGPPIPGCQVSVLDGQGRECPQGTVGTLHVRSTSMFSGYRNSPDKTAAVLRDGLLDTGDLGFLDGGEVFVVGRQKDVIIVAGKNLYPEDIEDAVGEVAGLIRGRVVAFGVEDPAIGTEQVWVVAETETRDPESTERLRAEVVRAAMRVDVTVTEVHLVPPRWLIKSSAGKPSRAANRERLLADLRTGEGPGR